MKVIPIYIQQDATLHSLFISGNCSTCFGWYLHPSSGAQTTVDTVLCAPDDDWRYHPKHVEQFPDKINCVTLHLVGYILEYTCDARTHERYSNIYPIRRNVTHFIYIRKLFSPPIIRSANNCIYSCLRS